MQSHHSHSRSEHQQGETSRQQGAGHTHNSTLEVLYPLLAHPVHEPPGPGGCILPQVAHGQVGVVADPSLLHVVGHAHQGQPGTAVRGHLVGLVPAVLERLREAQSREGLELGPWE